MIDDVSQQPVYQTLLSFNDRMSPQRFTPSPSYATLTPLQSQPINSVVSDSFTYVHCGDVSGSFVALQNNILNNNKEVFSSNDMSMSPPHLSSPNNVLVMLQYAHLSPYSSYSHNVLNSPETSISSNSYDWNMDATQSFAGNMNSPPTLGDIDNINSLTTITPYKVVVSPAPSPQPSHSHPSVVLQAVEAATSSPPMLTDTLTLRDASLLNSCGDTATSQACELEEINTKDLVQRISYELKRLGIPKTVFAKRVLCRSQGTVSDLLRNPKPWSKLTKGRETFRKMWRWLQEPESQKRSLRLVGDSMDDEARPKDCKGSQLPCPVAAQILQRGTCKRKEKPQIHLEHVLTPKKSRVVFTDLQLRTLRDIFKTTNWPTKQMQEMIARQLGLQATTVGNFFMNARQRSYKWKHKDLTKTAFTPSTESPLSPSSMV